MFDLFVPPTENPRPPVSEIEEIWDQRFTCTRPEISSLQKLEAMLPDASETGTKVLSIQCKLPASPALSWFMDRGQLTDIDFFYELFRSKRFKKALPKPDRTLIPPKVKRDFAPKRQGVIAESGVRRSSGNPVKLDRFNFSVQSCFTLTGALAGNIDRARSGQKSDNGDPATSPMQMAVDSADILLAGDYAGGLCYRSTSAWSPWFYAVEWDRTHVFINRESREATFIFMSDQEYTR
ncbi:MAG: hypothetical protein AAFR20_06635 [Pseudomonadota bacterium]